MKSDHVDNSLPTEGCEGAPEALVSTKVGFVSPWNQMCGLATYGRFLVEQFQSRDIVVFAERTPETTQPDEPFVRRCWTRAGSHASSGDYSELKEAVIREGIGVLHLNCQARFFVQPAFGRFLDEIRARGTKVVVQVHNLFTSSADLRCLVAHADKVLVHTPENRLEAIANGCKPSCVDVVPHGVLVRTPEPGETKRSLRNKLGLCQDKPIITAFGFLQPHKGMEAVIEAVLHLKQKGIAAKGIIVGQTRTDDPHSHAYAQALESLARSNGLSDAIDFVTSFVTDEQVGEYLAASDLVIMNYRSQHFEASGACALALGAGSIVMASLAPAMMGFGDAVWHLTTGYGPGLAAELILENAQLRDELHRTARQYCERNSWPRIAERITDIYRSLGFSVAPRELEDRAHSKEKTVRTNASTSQRKIRVLMQNRPSTFTQRGGDTVVLEKLRDGLVSRGWDVTVDVGATQDPKQFDLVHLFNFATVDYTRELAQKAYSAGVPYVVTTLYEDLPEFHNQSHVVASRLVEYVRRGQDKEWWQGTSADHSTVPKAPRFQCDWAAMNAAALFPNGAGEARALRRDYPGVKSVVEVPLGHEVGALSTSEAFEKEYGVKDFVFCVGRIESRKNQLMLLKALEDSDLTVVLAAGGFSYQPEYDQAVRSFKRKGRTLILDRLSPEMLSSAYAAARVHVLPSWYELPGLVSLEAAAHGKNIVVTRTGTTADYIGDKAFYCLPASEDSIASAVMAAYYAPVKPGLVDMARSHTWQKAVDSTIAAYECVLGISAQNVSQKVTGVYDMSMNPGEFHDSLEAGELAAKNMDFDLAMKLLQKAEKMDPRSVRVLKAIGAVYLAQSRTEDARVMFERALAVDPLDPKVLTGRGMCELADRKHSEAAPYLRNALNVAPDHLVAVHQFMECAYRLGSLDELRQVLERYLAVKPEDQEIRYCYAGCLFKQGRLLQSSDELAKVLKVLPTHGAALELRKLLDERTSEMEVEEVPTKAAPRKELVEEVVSATAIQEGEAKTYEKLTNPLQQSLAELSQRITEWKVSAESPEKQTTVRQSETVTFPDVPTPLAASPTSVPLAAATPEGNGHVEGMLEKVEDLKRQRLFEDAKAELERIPLSVSMSPAQSQRAKCLDAEFLVLEGDLGGAAAIYEQLLRENPKCARALCGKGALVADAQRWPEAKALFETALQAEPGYDVALAGLGLCAMVGNQEETAFDLFMQAARKNPENHRAIFGVLQLGYPLQRFSEIEDLLNAYLELHPASIDMLYSLAGVLFKQGKVSQARLEVEKILLFEPQNERALELQKIIHEKQSVASPMM
jgi:glycosyltransferase involved in cell wall biosynthesis/Tfp pilus assembly protein PilF